MAAADVLFEDSAGFVGFDGVVEDAAAQGGHEAKQPQVVGGRDWRTSTLGPTRQRPKQLKVCSDT